MLLLQPGLCRKVCPSHTPRVWIITCRILVLFKTFLLVKDIAIKAGFCLALYPPKFESSVKVYTVKADAFGPLVEHLIGVTSSEIVTCIMLWEGMPKWISYTANVSRVYFYQAKTRPAESGKYFRSITLGVHCRLVQSV